MLEDGSLMEGELTAMEMPTTGDRSRWWGLREHLPREPIFFALNMCFLQEQQIIITIW